MPRPAQLIGMIEIDHGPRCGRRADGTLQELLRSLQSAHDWDVDLGPGDTVAALSVLGAEEFEVAGTDEPVQVVHANLLQLRTELELELRRLVERLLAAM